MPDVSDESVEQVLVMFKCHLDVGFTDTEESVRRIYDQVHIPRAIDVASQLRDSGEDRYVWTVPAWMLYGHLQHTEARQRRRAEEAIAKGDLAWHALPFTWYTELLDRSAIAASLGFSAWLDDAFGKQTTAARLTDVPGHTRGLIAPLAEAGIRFLDIGVNPGCKAPAVPHVAAVGLPASDADEPDPDLIRWNADEPVHADQGTPRAELRRLATEGMNSPQTHLFRWQDDADHEITVLYHPHAYGSTVRIPGVPLAVSMRVHGDNLGPHSIESIRHSYASLRRKFPNAEVRAADLSTVGGAILATGADLPVETDEIGDSWIYGTGSDPAKTAAFREVLRLRSGWIELGELTAGSATDLALLEELIPAPEHNWGLSTSQHLRHWTGYATPELADLRSSDVRFKANDREWAAKREQPRRSVQKLPEKLRVLANARLESLAQPAPEPGREAAAGVLRSETLAIEVSSRTGALSRLTDRRSGREWAGPAGLGRFSYTAYDTADYEAFTRRYNHSAFTANDFGKPGLDRYRVEHLECEPSSAAIWAHEDALCVEIAPPERLALLGDVTSWPARVVLSYRLQRESDVEITCWVVGHVANRRPEALWLSFDVAGDDPGGWRLEKAGQQIDPRAVVADGGRRVHGIGRGVSYHDLNGALVLDSFDAHLVSPGDKGLLRFDNEPIDPRGGMHFALYNNLWGTAFPQWYDLDMRFRFRLRLPSSEDPR